MPKKRIHNKKIGKYLKIRERTTSEGRRGQIMGGYSSKTTKTINKNFSRAISKLSTK